MSTIYSDWYSYGSGGTYRLELYVEDPPAVGSGTSSVALTSRLYLQTSGSLSDTSNSNEISGDLGSATASVSVSHGSSGGRTLVCTRSGTISTVYGASVRVDVTGEISGYEALTSRSLSGFVRVPARPYSAPSAPTGVAAALVSGDPRVTWTRTSTTGAPWDVVRVRRSVNGGGYSTVATLAGTATSWTDSSAPLNASLRYEVRAEGPGGNSAYVTTGTVTTPPGSPNPPTGVTVTRSSDTRHTVKWTRQSTSTAPWDQVRVARSVDGGGFVSMDTLAGTATSWVDDTTEPNHSYRYEVRSGNSQGESVWVLSSTVYTSPSAPTGASVTRTSDTSHTVRWTNTASTATAVEVQRWDNRTGAWATRTSSVSASATSWTDTGTVMNRRYRYRVRATRSTLVSAFANTDYVKTTPATPTAVTASKSAAGITVRWTNNADVPDGFVIERSASGGAYGSPTTVAGTATSWTHTDPDPAETWQYRVRATVTEGASLASANATSNVVQLAAPPNAPSGLGPSTVRDADVDVTWHWTHNPTDSSDQSSFEVRHRAAGSTSWTTTGQVASGDSTWVLPGETYPNPVPVEWQVRTWGQHVDPSPWSATAVSPTSTPPTVAINTPEPDATVATSLLTVDWVYTDAEDTPQASWQVELLDDQEAVVEARSGAGPASSVALAAPLPDGAAWSVRVRVRDSDGMWSAWAVAEFTVEYAQPPAPTVDLTWDPDSGVMTVAVGNPMAGDGEVDADHVEVWRSIDGGGWELIATAVPPNTPVTDWTAPLAGTVAYRVDAVSALPSITSSVAEVEQPRSGSVFVSGGPGASQVCRALWNIALAETSGVAESTLHYFAGRSRPVAFFGEATSRTWALATDHIPATEAGDSTPRQWLDLARVPGPHLLRTPDGVRAWVALADVSAARGIGGAVTAVSMTLTEVDAP